MKAVNLVKATFLTLFLLGAGTVPTQAQTLADYSVLPPFLAGNVTTPNVLILMDNSGSMNNCAYSDKIDTGLGADDCLASSGTGLSDQYQSTMEYHGYFESDKCYNYASSKFSPTSSKPCSNTWDGNFLNWVTMRRLDITKWVMTGGQCNSVRSSENSCSTLRGQTSFNTGACCLVFYKQFNLNGLVPSATATNTRCIRVEGGNFYLLGNSSCSSSGGTSYFIRVDAGVKQSGVIQEVGDRARFGLMVFDDDGTLENGGEIRSDIGGNIVTLVNAIEGMVATSWTPLAESLYEAARYFAQIPPTPDSGTANYTVSVNNDPYCFSNLTPPSGETGCKNASQGRWVACCKSFVIVFTDGLPTNDEAIPSSLQGYASFYHPTPSHCAPPAGCTNNHTTSSHSHATVSNHFDVCSIYYGGESSDSCVAKGSHYLDDVAYWAHTTDLRPDTGNIAGINATPNSNRLPGMQSLTIYPFFAFGKEGQLLKDTAIMGGFSDLDGDGKPFKDGTCGTANPNPLCKEWDKDGDGVPDTYFESSNAFDLRQKLMAAITDILQKSASGTSVSVLATSSTGEGAIYQAYFYPSLYEGLDQITWLGYLQGLFFDANGQLREDSNGDGRLVLTQDKIIETYFDEANLETRVRRYAVDANGNKTGTPEVVALQDLKPIWEGGRVLASRNLSTNPRTIKTWVDSNANGVVDAGEFIDFTAANESTLRNYLRAADSTEGTKIIDFILGNTVSGYRKREVTVDGQLRTWRLGDIIYSSPISVGAPAERFDLRNQDSSYNQFYGKYKNRRHVVYVGANDGMLHAFNAGFFHPGDDPTTPSAVEHGWFTTDSRAMGEELWGFIPQELLPHLKWLTGSDYDNSKHVYYVDGTPRVTDARIFTEEAICATSLTNAGCIHPGGWGTVLIGSMRLGGGPITVNGDTTTFRSAYFAMDITDPEAGPKLLWVFKDSDLGFTTSWPAIMRFDAATWYVAFGSGPLTYEGVRDKTNALTSPNNNKFGSSVSEFGQIYVIDLKTGLLVNGASGKKQVSTTDRYAFMGDPAVYDLPQNYVTNTLYIGETYHPSGSGATGWRGKMFRLLTYGNADPSAWVLSVLYDPQKPVLVKPTATVDRSNRLWIYFGTGRFFSAGAAGDQGDTATQALFGIKESGTNGCWNLSDWKPNCSATVPSSALFDATNAAVSVGGACTNCGGASTLSGLISSVINSESNQGWLINLQPGERVLTESTVLGGIVAATTFTPDIDICASQGTNTLYAIYYESGTAFSGSVIGTTGTTVNRTMSLGRGMASKVNVVVSDQTTTGFVQSSTGQIVQIEGITLASNVRSGTRILREKSD